ncbi:MAG TPA: hypothetical protein VI365_02055 [Trebonia sp.]
MVATAGQARAASARLGRPLAALSSLGASAVLLALALDSAGIPARAVAWGGLALAAYIYGLLLAMLAIRGPDCSPGSWRLGPWMMIWAGTMYGLATVSLSQPQSSVAVQIIPGNVLRALWLVAAGTTMWWLGYMIGPGRLFRDAAARGASGLRRRFGSDVRSLLTPWLLYGIGSVARAATAITTSRFGYVGDAASAVSTAQWYDQVLILLSLCCPAAVAAAALQVFRQGLASARATMVILALAEAGYAIASGQKENFANVALAVAIPYTAARGRVPKTLLVVIAIVFLTVVIPFTQAYRNNARNTAATLSAGQAVSAAPQILRSSLSGARNLVLTVPESISYLLERGQDIDSPAIIIQRTPGQIPYSDPAELITGPLSALIPRLLWPGKPILATGYQFGQQYYELPPTDYTSPTVTPIGDLYRHGGWLPVLVGMLVLGCGIRLLDDVIDVPGNPHTVFLALLEFPGLVMSEQDWITLLADSVAFIALWWLIVAITFRRQEPA